MTTQWSLAVLFADFHEKIQSELRTSRKLGHPTDIGDASEQVWNDVLNHYLPKRYEARKGFVVDSRGTFSQQIDVIIHDRQYSPFVFSFKGTDVVPAESVYAVFEAKQELTADHVRYAMEKATSVRRLFRTSLAAQTIDGLSKPKPLHHILAGTLTLNATWVPPLGQTLLGHLQRDADGVLDIGCIADAGWYVRLRASDYVLHSVDKAATRFLFELIAQLQAIGTAPMLDIRAYLEMI
ncbi:hypothetical protein GOC72_28820 [Sinorhizobium medicae]|nr:hypothetical protein [Sinorhizobium medicae]